MAEASASIDAKASGSFSFDSVSKAVGQALSATSQITMAAETGTFLTDLGSISAEGMINRLATGARGLSMQSGIVQKATSELEGLIGQIPPGLLEQSTQAVLKLSVDGDMDLEGQPWLGGVLDHALAVNVSAAEGMDLKSIVSIMDSSPGGLSFGYAPVDIAVKALTDIAGEFSEGLDKIMANAENAISQVPMAQVVAFAIQFAGMVDGWRAGADKELVSEVAARERILQELRSLRNRPKRSPRIARLDGLFYGVSYDAIMRDWVLEGRLWWLNGERGPDRFGPRELPRLRAPAEIGVGVDGRTHDEKNVAIGGTHNWWKLYTKSLSDLLAKDYRDLWRRRAAVVRYMRSTHKAERALRSGVGQAYHYADGARALEHSKDQMLDYLIREELVPVREIQAISSCVMLANTGVGIGPGTGMYQGMVAPNRPHDGAIIYALSSPGTTLWTLWHQRAHAQLRIEDHAARSSSVMKSLASQADMVTHSGKGIVRRHPVLAATGALAAAAGVAALATGGK